MLSILKSRKTSPEQKSSGYQISREQLDRLVRRDIVGKTIKLGDTFVDSNIQIRVYEIERPIPTVRIFVETRIDVCSEKAYKGLWCICDEQEAKQLNEATLWFKKNGEGAIRISDKPDLKLPFGKEAAI